MKNILFVLVSLVSVLCVSCNNDGKWIDHTSNDYRSTSFVNDKMGVFTMYSNRYRELQLQSLIGDFLTREGQTYIENEFYKGTDVEVRLYDKKYNTSKNFILFFHSSSYDSVTHDVIHTRAFNDISISDAQEYIGYKDNIKYIINHINNGKGYVEFIAKLENNKNFTLIVPCKNN